MRHTTRGRPPASQGMAPPLPLTPSYPPPAPPSSPPSLAPPQDLLTFSCKGLGCWAHYAAQQGVAVPTEVYSLLHAATFATLTNVNFDNDRFKVRGRRLAVGARCGA